MYPYTHFFIEIFKDLYYYNGRKEMIFFLPLYVSILKNVIYSLTFIGGGVTAFCAFTKHKKTVLISSLTGLFGFTMLALRLLSPEVALGVFSPGPTEHISFNFGFYVFTAGAICLLISAGKAFFDRKEGTN